jgi:hypothetical protein
MKPKFSLGNPATLGRNGCEYTFTPVSDGNDPPKVACVQVTRRWLVDPPDSPVDDMGSWTVHNATAMWKTLTVGGYRPL